MQLTSPAFQAGEPIPARFSCEGENISPELRWQGAPEGTRAYALVMHDPDAPRAGGFSHWVLFNIPAEVNRLSENIPANETVEGIGIQGKNDKGQTGYTGPCPPSGRHRYFFKIFALSQEIHMAPGASHKEVAEAMTKYVIDRAELMGTYAKQSQQAA